jgi:hypothetical protein
VESQRGEGTREIEMKSATEASLVAAELRWVVDLLFVSALDICVSLDLLASSYGS